MTFDCDNMIAGPSKRAGLLVKPNFNIWEKNILSAWTKQMVEFFAQEHQNWIFPMDGEQIWWVAMRVRKEMSCVYGCYICPELSV